jgi:hypothetical protein
MRWFSTAAAGTHGYPFPTASELLSVAPRGASSTAGGGTSELLAPLVISEATERRNGPLDAIDLLMRAQAAKP